MCKHYHSDQRELGGSQDATMLCRQCNDTGTHQIHICLKIKIKNVSAHIFFFSFFLLSVLKLYDVKPVCSEKKGWGQLFQIISYLYILIDLTTLTLVKIYPLLYYILYIQILSQHSDYAAGCMFKASRDKSQKACRCNCCARWS